MNVYVAVAAVVFVMLLTRVASIRVGLQEVCPQPSSPVQVEYTGVKSDIACGVRCSVYSGCSSFAYSDDSKTCALISEVWIKPTTSGCDTKISYGVMVCSGACTTPISNVRLCEGAGPDKCSATTGRLELYRDGIWGTVSDHGWGGQIVTDIICRTLGYSTGTVRRTPHSGTGRLWMSHVKCVGEETSLFECSNRLYRIHTCSHKEDIEISCS